MQEFLIDYDESKGRFILAGPTWQFQPIQLIPYRKWDKKTRTFSIPSVARNVDALQTHFGGARWTQRAKAALMDAGLAEQHRTRRAVGFPTSYVFKRPPLDHQAQALNFCYGNDATGLFMEMRTGKTKVIVDLYSQYYIEDKIDAALIICPMSARHVWKDALADDCPISYDVRFLDSSNKESLLGWMMQNDHRPTMKWLIASVESFSQGTASKICEKFLITRRAALGLDESSKIKNPTAIRAKISTKLSRYANQKDILNGTPGAIAKGIEDLYQQFEFLDPSIIGIGDFYSFRNRYCVMGGYEGRQIVGYQNMDELMKLLAPYVFEVRKADALPQLAGKKIGPIKRIVKMSDQQRKAYTDLEKNGLTEVAGGVVEVKMVLERMLRFQQIVAGHISRSDPHPWKKKKDGTPVMVSTEFDIEGKNPKIEELFDVIEQNEGACVIWSRFDREIDKICASLREVYGADQVVEFHGRVDEEQRNINKKLFQDGKARFLVVNQMTGSMSIELSRARTMIYVSNTFSFLDRNQSEERPFSKNLDHSVLIVDIVIEQSVDETIQLSIQTKSDMAEFVRLALKKHSVNDLVRGRLE